MQNKVSAIKFTLCAVVPGRNRALFRCIFQLHYRVQSTVTQYFRYGWGSYVLCKFRYVSTARMSPTLNRYSGNVIEICNGRMFDFYPGLPHV